MTSVASIDAEKAARDRIKLSHLLNGQPQQLIEYYRDWACSYDVDVSRERYRGPDVVAELVSVVHAAFFDRERADLRVLDAGCGTGLVGVALARRGFRQIDGFDLSDEMAVRAGSAGAYRNVLGGVDLNQRLEGIEPGAYDITTCCGVFTLGHVEPQGLWELARATRAGGFLLVSTRKSYFEKTAFEEEVERIRAAGRLRIVNCLRDGAYVAEEGAHYWVFQVLEAGDRVGEPRR